MRRRRSPFVLVTVVLAIATVPAAASAAPVIYRGSAAYDSSEKIELTLDKGRITDYRVTAKLRCPDGSQPDVVAAAKDTPGGYTPVAVSNHRFEIDRGRKEDPTVFIASIRGALSATEAQGDVYLTVGQRPGLDAPMCTEEFQWGAVPTAATAPPSVDGTLYPARSPDRRYFIVISGLACHGTATHVLFTVARHRATVPCGKHGLVAVSRTLRPRTTYRVRVQPVQIRRRNGHKRILRRGERYIVPIEVFAPNDSRWHAAPAGLPGPL